MKHYLDAAENAARAAGDLLRKNFHRSQHVNVAERTISNSRSTLRHRADHKALLKQFRNMRCTAKRESSATVERPSVGSRSARWHRELFLQIPHFCVSIALRLKGEIIVGVIYDPMRDEMWSAQKGEKPCLNGQHFRVSARTICRSVVSSGSRKRIARSIRIYRCFKQ